jgi:hypothetical protein
MSVRAFAAAGAIGVVATLVTTLWPALAWEQTNAAVVLAANVAEDHHHSEALESDAQVPPASIPESASSGSQSVVYIPPTPGEPRARIGAGGVRGSSKLAAPTALAPDHVGLTATASPSLFWHIGALPGRDVDTVFTLINDEMIAPLAEVTLDDPGSAGIQRLRLSELGVQLEPGVEYTWSIALVSDAEHRSNDLVSLGFIRRVARPEALAAGTPDGAAFAEAGLWYDALEALSDAIDVHPVEGDLWRMRSSLLQQAQLDAAVQ